MKSLLISLSFVAPLLLLSGCASTQGMTYGDAPQHPHESIVEDDQYVAFVEHIAKQRGTSVVWLNPPNKRVPEKVADNR
ncbi:MAG: hypothetical protein ABWX93_05715 [Pseudoxanthomonas sp.]